LTKIGKTHYVSTKQNPYHIKMELLLQISVHSIENVRNLLVLSNAK